MILHSQTALQYAMDKSAVIEAFPTSRETLDPRDVRPRRWWQFGGKDRSYVSVDAGYESNSSASSSEDLVKNIDNVYVAPEAVDLYKPVEGFEGTHRFDPTATWSAEEEKKLVRRVCVSPHFFSDTDMTSQLDWRVALPACKSPASSVNHQSSTNAD